MEIEVSGCRIRYRITGTGEKIAVILQGWGTSLEVYDSIAEILNRDYTVVQFDFPGFGGSDEPPVAWGVGEYGDFFCAFMEKLNISRASLIGHSFGGRVIIKLAARESLPFEISRMVLIDSGGIMPKRTLLQKVKTKQYKVLKKLFGLKLIYFLFPEIIDDWRSRQGSADYRNASPMMRQCLVKTVNEDLTELLPNIRKEVLLIWGDQDTATPLSDARVMEEKIPNSGLVLLKGAGHYSFLEQPAVFKNVMLSYFQIGVEQK
ncbi:MAG: alpha/beta hydrolase [Lachnospiraceae bacterium]|nr:alpha/beta hydrolase [Lachnospiraceae bacterium]